MPEQNRARPQATDRITESDLVGSEPVRISQRLFPSKAHQVDDPEELYRDTGGLGSMLRLPPLGPEGQKLNDWIKPYLYTQWERRVWSRYQKLTEMSEEGWNRCKAKAAAEGIDYLELHARNVLLELQMFVTAEELPHPEQIRPDSGNLSRERSVDDLPGDRFREHSQPQQRELFRWLRISGRVTIDRLHSEYPDWAGGKVQVAAVQVALRRLRDALDAYGDGWRLVGSISDEVWLVPPQ